MHLIGKINSLTRQAIYVYCRLITNMMLAEINSAAYGAGSPWSDSYRGGGWLHPCVPHPALGIPGATPEGRVGSKWITTLLVRVYNLNKDEG